MRQLMRLREIGGLPSLSKDFPHDTQVRYNLVKLTSSGFVSESYYIITMNTLDNYLFISVLDLKEWLAIHDVELGNDGARVKDAPVLQDVVTVHLPKDPPVLEAAVEGLVSRPYARLHAKILGGVAIVVGALDLVGVPHVAVVGFDPLAWLEKVGEFVHEDLDVRPGAGGVGSADRRPRLNSPREYRCRARSGARSCPHICGNRRRSPSLPVLAGGSRSLSR